MAASAFNKVTNKTPRVQTPHPPRRPGDIANFQPQHTSLSSLNPTLTPADTQDFDFVPHHFSVDSFQKRQLPCNSGSQVPCNSGTQYSPSMGELQADQGWYAPYHTNASDAPFMSDPNVYYSQMDNELFYYYPQSSSAPPLYPDPFPPSQMCSTRAPYLASLRNFSTHNGALQQSSRLKVN